jgi:hypothetical protein
VDLNYNLIFAGVSAVAAIASSVTGVFAWRATRSAKDAAQTSAQVAQEAEQYRRWDRLTPELSFTLTTQDTRGELRIRVDGPYVLERLDRVTVTIRDDRPDRGRWLLAGGPTAEQISAQVWGPYRLNQHVENVDRHGRTVVFPNGVTVGEEVVCAMEATSAPPWNPDSDHWSALFHDGPIRIMVECERAGFAPWRIPAEVQQPSSPSIH